MDEDEGDLGNTTLPDPADPAGGGGSEPNAADPAIGSAPTGSPTIAAGASQSSQGGIRPALENFRFGSTIFGESFSYKKSSVFGNNSNHPAGSSLTSGSIVGSPTRAVPSKAAFPAVHNVIRASKAKALGTRILGGGGGDRKGGNAKYRFWQGGFRTRR